MFRALTSLLILVLTSVTPAHLRADVVLLMAEERGCIYCAAWNREIGTIYDKTGEGEAAPLMRYDIADPLPVDITLARSINFTPTFVLLVDEEEVSRLEGYPGEDFFWGLLGMMLINNEVPFEIKEAGTTDVATGDF